MPQKATSIISKFLITHRIVVISIVGILTALLMVSALKIKVVTTFSDLMPSDHEYIKINDQYKESFGGSNIVSIMVKVREGDIFQTKVLEKIATITNDLLMVTGVNDFQIISMASRKLKKIRASTYGIETIPLMWPNIPQTDDALAALRKDVLTNPLVYGTYVSKDLKAALITVDFIDSRVDYDKIYSEISAIVERVQDETVEIDYVGEPILRGIVNSYLPETIKIFGYSLGVIGLVLLLVFMKSWRGTLIPLANAFVSAIWALGIAQLFGFNFDPLSVVVTFLITARVISHSVQSVTRFDETIKVSRVRESKNAANITLAELWTPGMLSVITDAGGILVVALAPIPLLQKTAYLGAIWVSCIVVTGVIMTPLLLSWVPVPQIKKQKKRYSLNDLINKILATLGSASCGRTRYAFVIGSAIIMVVCGYYSIKITVGDANPGTPILWQESVYNNAVEEINSQFLGTDRMFIVLKGDDEDTLKNTEILQNIESLQRYVEVIPEIGGSLAITDLIPAVNRVLNEDNPKFEEKGQNKNINGELLYVFTSSADPGDLDRFSDEHFKDGAVTLFFRDHKGGTVRAAISRIKEYIANNTMNGAEYKLAGGLIGVIAAVNEVIFAGQVESIAFALLVVCVTCSVTYRSGVAGLYFMVPILISNVLTFTYMYFKDIGLNINTLPVAALGIGLGVDYSIYVVDSIKEHFEESRNLEQAIYYSLRTAGRGVINTATPLIVSTTLWYFLSSMRFQAEMAILIAIWMGISATSALVVMPSVIRVLKPKFVVGGNWKDVKKSQDDNSMFQKGKFSVETT